MVRVSKQPEVRRREILDAAVELFARKGYAATSINDILEAVGIAKGTFYYHFAAKDEVMRAVVVQLVEEGIAHARVIAADRSLPVAERVLAIIASQRAHGDKAAMVNSLHEAGNAEFHLLSHTALIERLTPVIAAVVREGITAGVFDTPFPDESVEMILTAVSFLTEGGFESRAGEGSEGAGADRDNVVPALLLGAERLLGAAPGTFTERAGLVGGE